MVQNEKKLVITNTLINLNKQNINVRDKNIKHSSIKVLLNIPLSNFEFSIDVNILK